MIDDPLLPAANASSPPTFALASLVDRVATVIEAVVRCAVAACEPVAQAIARALVALGQQYALVSRRPHRHRPRNTRIQMVQAKRRSLNLDQDGMYPGLQSRKASYAYAQEVERWCQGKREHRPLHADFRQVPARRRKKEVRRQRRWTITPDLAGKSWIDVSHANAEKICLECGIGAPVVGALSQTGGVIPPGGLRGSNDGGPEVVFPGSASQILPNDRGILHPGDLSVLPVPLPVNRPAVNPRPEERE